MKQNKKKEILIFTLVSIAISFVLGFIINSIIHNHFKFIIQFRYLTESMTYLYMLLILLLEGLIFLLYYYKHYWLLNSKNIIKGKLNDLHLNANLEESRFQTNIEIERNYTVIDYDELKNTEITGSIIKAEEKNGRLKVTFAKACHTLVIGTTGSGKTTTYVNPMIQILAETKNKPSMLITDPKGELYKDHVKHLTDLGYEIKVIDLRNPYNSTRWNPLERAYLFYQESLHLDDKVEVDEEYGCYFFEGKEYRNLYDLESAKEVKKQKLLDIVYEDIHDITTALCPITNKNEPMWESGARNFILAILLAMLEDSENPELGLTKDKFNFFSLMKVATKTDNDCEYLLKYFQNRRPLSKAVTLSKQVLDASEKTRGSYLSTVFDKLSIFADLSLCALTSENEIEFASMAEKPIALFLQIPDEKETRHTLATLVIIQAYKELVQKANTYSNLSLPKPVYFIMDEFGNLPKIAKLEQMITVGRSRNIWLNLVVQSYAQLGKVYDELCADIVKSNCNIQIFIGTTDFKTIEEFSKRCGNFSIVQRSVGFNSAKGEDINSNSNVKERPLVYPSELQLLNNNKNMGNAIVTVFGYHPIKSVFTPSFKSSFYDLNPSKQRLFDGRYFDEEKAFYDMTKKIRLDSKKVEANTEASKEIIKEKTKVPKQLMVNQMLELIRKNKELFTQYYGRVIRKQIQEFAFDKLINTLQGIADDYKNNGNLEREQDVNFIIKRVRIMSYQIEK